MTDGAGRPAGPSGASGPRPGREPESASFEAARVPVRRGRPPVFVLGFVLVVTALVAVGVGGRGPAEPTDGPPAALDSPNVDATRGALVSSSAAAPASPGMAPIWTSEPGPIRLLARRHEETLFVHGDVFVPHVTGVFVSLHDAASRVVGWASVSVPGAAGPGTSDGPTLRFDVELPIPAGLTGRLWVQASAYDTAGAQISSPKLEIPPID